MKTVVAERQVASPTHGWVAPGFEEVRAEFERNFAERGEIGAAVAAYWRGQKVVDLWGGRRAPDGDAPWNEDTLVLVHSSTKGLSAMTVAVATARGWLDYDAPVARYWPEFAQNGKGAITVRQLLGHEAGLVWLDEPLPRRPAPRPRRRRAPARAAEAGVAARDAARLSRDDDRALHAGADPPRGSGPSHARAVLPGRDRAAAADRSSSTSVCRPQIPADRLATLKVFTPWRALKALPSTPHELVLRVLWPWSLARKSMLFADLDPNDRRYLEVEVPAGNGVGTARAMARAYSAFAEGGAALGLTPATMAALTAPPAPARVIDAVLGVPSWYSLGYLRPGPDLGFGSSPRAFGTPGAGGSFAFADPDARLGYAYVMNKMDFYLFDDPREKALRDAVHRAVRRLT